MNTKTLIAASILALIGSTAAVAQEAIPATWANEVTSQSVNTGKTRAEVRAELVAARANGEVDQPSDFYGLADQSKFASSTTRAQVVAEYKKARAAGQLDLRGELYGTYDPQSAFVSTKTRAEVKAEVLQAIASGEHLSQGDRTGG